MANVKKKLNKQDIELNRSKRKSMREEDKHKVAVEIVKINKADKIKEIDNRIRKEMEIDKKR